MADSQLRVAIVGAGHAGGRVAQHLRSLGHTGSIALIGDEQHAPYERPALSKELLLGEKSTKDLTLAPADFWNTGHPHACIDRYVRRVRRVLPERRELILEDDNTCLTFDRLVVATGGFARIPCIVGADDPNIHTLRTIDDCIALREAFACCKSIAIVGGGVIGMEVAAAASKLGVQATVFEASARIMSRILPKIATDWLSSVHRAHGIQIETGTQVRKIERTESSSFRIWYGYEEECITADLVLIAAGIECSADFLDGTSIATSNGIPVDAFCRSPVAPWCYAAGDIAATDSKFYGRALRQETWRNAENQARAVAEFICGRDTPFIELPWMWTDQYDFNIQVIGQPLTEDEIIERGSLGSGTATLVSMREGLVTGAVMVNQGRDRRVLERLIEERTVVDPRRMADVLVPLKQVAA